MTADRTITVHTRDHGTITIPEPTWCTGIHHQGHPPGPDGTVLLPPREEIVHSGPPIDVTVNTEQGPRRLIELMLWQDPFPTPSCTHSDEVYVVVQLLDDHAPGYDPDGLDALATDLMEAAAKVRGVARRLAVEHRGEGR
ncbi:DUF6907 domain-containing protein [Streptomyces sp. IBSBF 2435]|uniref:DUF6907 domain-containing protein n=1 Tax=Streptomyces sp. IBSBF 2435 TaxID=2903531 RepID=UPI002FDBDDB4